MKVLHIYFNTTCTLGRKNNSNLEAIVADAFYKGDGQKFDNYETADKICMYSKLT